MIITVITQYVGFAISVFIKGVLQAILILKCWLRHGVNPEIWNNRERRNFFKL